MKNQLIIALGFEGEFLLRASVFKRLKLKRKEKKNEK